MSKSLAIVSRTSTIVAAAALVAASLVPAILFSRADAGQVTSRSIQLSNSATGATGVTYKTTFNVATTGTVEGVVVDICSRDTSPLIGTACTAPTSFSWQAVPTIVTATINGTDVSGWTQSNLNSNRTFTLSDATGQAVTAGQTIVIEISGVANPSDVDTGTVGNQVGTFYGRMLTYNDNTEVANYNDTDGSGTAGIEDFGGAALSTTDNLTVTARVQESLTFCVYTTGANCAGASGSSIDIPDATTPLSPTAVSINNAAKFSVASNALNGVNVRMWSNNGSEGVLESGAYTITAFGPVVDDACTADSAVSSVEQFGMRISAVGAGQTASAPYNCGASNHGWDTDSAAGAGANDTTTVGSSYGDTIATTAGATDESQSTLEFAAKSALTTEAGIYQSVLNFIATGTY